MGAVDPTYPLYSIACMVGASLLLLVLFNSFTRQNLNTGVTFLCLWLFLENLTNGIDAIIWADNAEVKLYVYCDFVSRLKVATYVGKPLATFLITRRLYLIAKLQSVEIPCNASRTLEWTLGTFIPLLIAGPIYYVHQGGRFEVYEGFGCSDVLQTSILEILTIKSWTLVPPLISTIFYLPLVLRVFYRRNRDINSLLQSNTSLSQTSYLRILALASIDLLLTLPINIASTILNLTATLAHGGRLPFYPGWAALHSWKAPASYSYANITAGGTSDVAQFYFTQWTSPVVAFIIFGLFGLTPEARASYRRAFSTVGGWLGWEPPPHAEDQRASFGEMEFEVPQQDLSPGGIESGHGSRRSSFLMFAVPATKKGDEYNNTASQSSAPESDLQSTGP